MAVQPHTHTFEIPTATAADVATGTATDLVVVPAALGSAAASDAGDFATAAQGALADTALQPGDAPIYEAIYDTVDGMSAITVPEGVNAVRVNGYYSAGDGGAALYKHVLSEPSHAGKFQSADGAWWEIASETLRLRMFGAKGDWDPDTRTGADDTLTIEAAFAAATLLNLDLHTGAGVFYHLGELNYPSGLRVFGESRLTSQFYLEINNTQAGGRIETQKVRVEDIGHVVYLTAGIGPDGGEYGSGWTLGRYFSNGTPVETGDVTFERCGVYAAPGSPFSPAHGLNCVGRVRGVYADGFEADGFAGSAIHAHWGADGAGIDLPIVATYHPNEIRSRGLTVKNGGCAITLSSCFDVSITGIRAENTKRFCNLLPGDEADAYAVAEEKPLVGSSIHISEFEASGLEEVSGSAPIRVFSTGTSRAGMDAATGLGTRRNLAWKKVVIENGKLTGADNVSRAADLTSAVGDVTLRNVDLAGVARSGIGLRLADTRGNIILDNVSIASATGIEWARAWGVKCVNMELNMMDRTGLAGDLIGVSVNGSEFTKTLSANKTAGATSISLASALGAVLNPGDTIIVDGNHVKVTGTRIIRSTETVIPIEAMSWTASAGATVYCDQRSVPKLLNSKIASYDIGVLLDACKQVDICANEFIDIAKLGVTGIAKSGTILRNKFIRGGQHRLTDGAYASRNLSLIAGSENVTVRDNEFGVDADYIDMLVQTSADTGNMRIKDNALGNAITSHLSVATQSNARLDASQFNECSGNYRKDGGQVTGPGTWYEVLQNGIVRYHGTAAPTRGFHRAGSEWAHTSPAAGQPTGGMCTASGTPGTWVNKANL